jgi:hypothetical protein
LVSTTMNGRSRSRNNSHSSSWCDVAVNVNPSS